MPSQIDGLGLSPQTLQQTNDAAQSQQIVGQRDGQKVVQNTMSEASLVEQSLEELPANLSEKSSKKLADRTAKGRAANRLQEIIQKYLRAVGGVNQTEKFEQLAESLRKLGKATPEQIKQQLEEHLQEKGGDADSGLESALLLALEELFSADGTNAELLSAIREVKAGLGNDLRDFYTNQVKSYDDVSDVYQELLGEHGEEDFLKATETLITRLGNDLQSQGSSVESSQVKATVDSLYHLEVARNTYMAFAGLIDKMQTLFNVGGNETKL